MVAVINTGNSINRALNYNEQKVQEEKAKCIGAFNYPKDVGMLNFHEKLNMLKRQAELNENVKRNSVHISLNFDPSDQVDHHKLLVIAEEYMKEIGFEKQPYLVYEHKDAAHPHIHVVSVKVSGDGSRINMQNIGRNQSRKACETLEKAFNLTVAKGRNKCTSQSVLNSAKVLYGKSETKRAICNVLGSVLHTYLYTSLPELNAVLKEYNVLADRGNPTSRVFNNQGLLYHTLNEFGKPTGVPIKASLFYNNPGVKFLEVRFKENELKRTPHKARIKNIIDMAVFYKKSPELKNFTEALKKAGIQVVLRTNAQGAAYGITYIDHQTKCVFNGSDLGKQYSIKAIIDRTQSTPKSWIYRPNQLNLRNHKRTGSFSTPESAFVLAPENRADLMHSALVVKLIEGTLKPEFNPDYIAFGFKRKAKKKRRLRPGKL